MPIVAGEITANLDGLAAVFTQLMTWIGTLVTTIASNPLLLVSLGVFVAGAVIGLAVRLIRG